MSYVRWVPIVIWLSSCASTAPLPTPSKSSAFSPPVERSTADTFPRSSGDTKLFNEATQSEKPDQERLAALWQKRAQEKSNGDIPIGPGDVLEINVQALADLQNRVVRVSGEGTIKLPWIGEMHASGFTDATLTEEIKRKLQEHYMYNPQVHLFVREYHSRQVAVLGAVSRPG